MNLSNVKVSFMHRTSFAATSSFRAKTRTQLSVSAIRRIKVLTTLSSLWLTSTDRTTISTIVSATEILVRDKVKSCRFESNSAGRRVAEKIQEEVKKKGGITHITTKFTTANKETKIIVNSAWVKEHCLFKDASLYQKKSDYGKMMDMLCSYTVAGKNKHDDVPDGMAMLAEYAQSLSGQKVEVFKRPW